MWQDMELFTDEAKTSRSCHDTMAQYRDDFADFAPRIFVANQKLFLAVETTL